MRKNGSMKIFMIVFIGLFLMWPMKNAKAEGGTCPPGYYPHNVPGVMGCAPIPGYVNPAQPMVRRSPATIKWGAIAIDDTSGGVGFAEDMNSKGAAETSAMAECLLNGTVNCAISIAYYNSCGVVAWGDSNYATASSARLWRAQEMAMDDCGKRTKNCKIYYEYCSLPDSSH